MNLKAYAYFLKTEHLQDLALETLALALKKEIPLMNTFAGLPYEQMLGFSEKGLSEQLESFIDGTALSKAVTALEQLRHNEVQGVEISNLKIDDFIYLYSCQKQALVNYLPYFEKEMSKAVGILYEIESYYSEVQKAAFQTLVSLHNQTLEENERNYRFLAENASDIIFRIDAEGNIIYISSAVQRLLGYSPQELQLTRLSELTHPADRARLEESLRQLSSEVIDTFTYRIRSKGGKYHWFETAAKSLYNENGALTEIHGASRDVTARRLNEEKIRRSEMLLNETQHIAQIGSWEWDFVNNTVNWSDEHYRLYGLTPGQQVPYASVREATVDNMRELLLRESVTYKRKSDFVHRVVVNDEVRYMHIIAEPVLDEDGNVILLRGTTQDVTRLKHTERELERINTELMQFASVASHDLKEPLRKIMTFCNLLETMHKDKLPEEGAFYVTKITESARRMQVLINDLLSFSRLNAPEPSMQKTDFNELISDILQDLDILILEKEANIIVKKLPVISVNAGQMRQVFQNLIANALKFTRKGVKPQIEIYAHSNNSQSTIYVKDNGIGFDEKYLEKIFTIFQRLHPRDEYEGTGIGLAICRKVMELHKGSITATSVPDKGATFMLTLPMN